MSFPLTAAGLLFALACAEVAVSRLARAAVPGLRPGQAAAGYWPAGLLYGGVSAAAFTGLGALPALQGALLAALLIAADAWWLLEPVLKAARLGKGRAVGRRILTAALTQVRDGPWCLREDFRALLRLLPRNSREAAAQAPVAAHPAGAPARAVPPPRDVPQVREDPVLGAPPAPADVAAGLAAAGAAVPPAWAALCDAVASFEADTDEDLLAHVAGEAAGILTYSEAVRARADTLLHGTGLDPAYVAGHYEFADEFADLASAVAMVDRRFHAIYGAVREWVAGGGILPHNARQWLGGGDADAGPGDDVAA